MVREDRVDKGEASGSCLLKRMVQQVRNKDVGGKMEGATGERCSYAQVNRANVHNHSCTQLVFNRGLEDLNRFDKALVGVVVIPGSSYCIQDSLYGEGYFNVIASPLGANMCLLEEKEEGVLEFY